MILFSTAFRTLWTNRESIPGDDITVEVGYIKYMTPQDALQLQIERYRGLTGEQRLAIALDLHELSCDIAREGIHSQHPSADEKEVERLLRYRLELVRGS
jgi:Rv0078B-related antitoxin